MLLVAMPFAPSSDVLANLWTRTMQNCHRKQISLLRLGSEAREQKLQNDVQAQHH